MHLTSSPATLDTADMAADVGYISLSGTAVDAELLERFHSLGMKMLSTRSIGFDTIDLDAAKRLGIAVSHATYSPRAVWLTTRLCLCLPACAI